MFWGRLTPLGPTLPSRSPLLSASEHSWPPPLPLFPASLPQWVRGNGIPHSPTTCPASILTLQDSAAASTLLLLSPSGPRVVRPLLSSHLSGWFSSISDLTLILNAGQSRLVLGPPLYACSYLCFHGLNTSPDLLQMSRSVPPTSYRTPALKVSQVPQIYQIEN